MNEDKLLKEVLGIEQDDVEESAMRVIRRVFVPRQPRVKERKRHIKKQRFIPYVASGLLAAPISDFTRGLILY